jgi:3D (Asp-Asp-Asp) domain-containing protein
MMKNLFLYIVTFYILFNPLHAKGVDCRNLSTKVTSECNTYGAQLIYNVKASDPKNRKKLITTKTLPVPKKKKVKVITVNNLIEEHIKVHEPIRYRGTHPNIGIKKGRAVEKIVKKKEIKEIAKKESKKEIKKVKKTQKVAKKKSKKEKVKKDKLVKLIENWDKDKKSIYVKKGKKKKIAKKKRGDYKFLKRTYNRKMRVLATAYTSHRSQTDSTPFIAAWGHRLRPGMKIIAVSRDLLKKYGLRNGTKVKISGLRGTYVVRDKMNKRFRKKIDIYMGTNKRRALRWGRRYVTIYW